MKACVAKIEKNRVQLEVEVDVDQVNEALEQAYKRLVRKYNIPGFRRGKAPRRLLENYIGKAPFLDEALDIALPGAYRQAVEETNIQPIDKPQVELVQLEEGKTLIFKATVDIKPEIKLGEYKGLEVNSSEILITEQQVENYLTALQRRFARLVSVEGQPAQQGDIVQISYEAFTGGDALPGGKQENHSLEIGSSTFPPEFEGQLVGMNVDEERAIDVTFPAEHPNEQIAGKEVNFQVKLLGIKRKELSPIDDEFAKDVSEFESLEELRRDVENKLKQAAEEERRTSIRKQVVAKVTETVEVELPRVMVERRIDTLISDMEQRVGSQGISFDKYLEYTNTTLEGLRDSLRIQAEFAVKSDLVLEAVTKSEGLEAFEEELQQEVEKVAKAYGQEPQAMRELLQSQDSLDALKYGIKLDKAVEFLIANANVTTIPEPEPEPVQEMAEK